MTHWTWYLFLESSKVKCMNQPRWGADAFDLLLVCQWTSAGISHQRRIPLHEPRDTPLVCLFLNSVVCLRSVVRLFAYTTLIRHHYCRSFWRH
ncbi:hypothetical protein AVEN_303-1 [Araneus ventricosus]|uniref:Uncharacterized protein n=1 Tax=Araneus ventricosus TaxID=182803 RepID=A0A4Y2I333_ARAVE|nr:hypothetical protein AVEN_303-1 [Araneus ventricosus]